MITWLKEKLNPKYKFNEKEQLILDIVTNLCKQSDTEIKMAPISGRYFLVNKRLEYWLRIGDDGITITNHKFTLTNTINSEYQKKLIAMIDTFIEADRNEFEQTIFQNEVELLENIISNIKFKE